ncbi:ankyrin repeat domain-containing protein, chloroplastic [Gossypium australe]|uniref:Ankyrin repeat domain-containing protein, chloroplastic n=1 Tax=Gossypium australe TaxID=47621 RepID=A0A5B6UL65_9ROSI|nr:ankyrin repeat domain-containing protein, chloroplastic [Gossypium australe]
MIQPLGDIVSFESAGACVSGCSSCYVDLFDLLNVQFVVFSGSFSVKLSSLDSLLGGLRAQILKVVDSKRNVLSR